MFSTKIQPMVRFNAWILDKSLKDAMRARDSQKISTIRLINAAIKDRDIAVRSEDNLEGVSDEEILSILSKMIKQRQESAKQYEEGGRLELAQQEFDEIKIIETCLLYTSDAADEV